VPARAGCRQSIGMQGFDRELLAPPPIPCGTAMVPSVAGRYFMRFQTW
jgi:hypothetical protein